MCNLAKREDFFIEKVRQKMRKYEKQTKNSKMKHMNSAKYTKWSKNAHYVYGYANYPIESDAIIDS